MFPKIGGFPPKSSIFIGFSIINHPFWGIPIFGNTQINMHAFLTPKHLYPHRLLATWRHRSRLDLSHLGCLQDSWMYPGPQRGRNSMGNPQISPKIVGSYGLSSLIQRWFQGLPSTWRQPLPIGSMYGKFACICLIFMVKGGKYTIHGSYGVW